MSGISGFKLAQQEAAIKKNVSDKVSGPSYTVGTWTQNDLGYAQSQLPTVNMASQPLLGALFSLGGILFSLLGSLFGGNSLPAAMTRTAPPMESPSDYPSETPDSGTSGCSPQG